MVQCREQEARQHACPPRALDIAGKDEEHGARGRRLHRRDVGRSSRTCGETQMNWPRVVCVGAFVLALACGHAQAEPVKIRASWIVAPSDWTPLLLEKPDLMRHQGKSY